MNAKLFRLTPEPDHSPAKTKTSKMSEETKSDKMAPNGGNGADLEAYSWTQTLPDIEIRIPLKVDFTVKSRDVIVQLDKKHMKVQLKGKNRGSIGFVVHSLTFLFTRPRSDHRRRLVCSDQDGRKLVES